MSIKHGNLHIYTCMYVQYHVENTATYSVIEDKISTK